MDSIYGAPACIHYYNDVGMLPATFKHFNLKKNWLQEKIHIKEMGCIMEKT